MDEIRVVKVINRQEINDFLNITDKTDVGIALAHFDMTMEENGYAGSFAFADPGIQAPSETYYIVTYERER